LEAIVPVARRRFNYLLSQGQEARVWLVKGISEKVLPYLVCIPVIGN
jgi:hypothetical protein